MTFDEEVYEYAKSRNGTEDSRMTDRMLAYRAGAKSKEKRIAELEHKLAISEHDREHNDYELTEVYKKVAELEAQIEKMKCLNEEIIKALKESWDYEWLPAHNGKAKYLYLQTVIDIVNEKFEEIKENDRQRNLRN